MRNVREKKHRLPRECYQGIVTVSFTLCIEQRRTPFLQKSIVAEFLNALNDGLTKNKCAALIYCFMPDHLHVLVRGLDKTADTWQAMVDFKQKTGYWFGQNGREFKWQKDFHDHIIRVNEDLAAHVRYIADNPVRKCIVDEWSMYPFTGSIGFELTEILADASTL